VLARDGAHPLGLDRAFADLAELARWNNAHAPNSRAARVGTAPYHHAGATATQDIAYSIATAIVYLRVLTNAGLSVDDAAKQIRFSFAVGCNFFLAAAKLRAARRLWHHTLDACNATDPDARMSMHIKPSKRITTRRDPWINILRNTATTFAASLAGAESITTAPFDDALGDPEDTARRLARNTQLILTEESNLHRVVDPAGGSWFIESLTDELARKAWPLIQHIEHRGGMTEALKSGLIHEQIDSAFRSKEQRIATRKQPITGVTEFPDTAEQIPARPARDHAAIRSAATHRINERSTTPDLHEKLAQLAAADGHARFDAATRAADAGATLDQLTPNRPESAADQITPISPHPYAAPFEALRDAADTRAGSV
jgi:methylmalonyl-CoA mutase